MLDKKSKLRLWLNGFEGRMGQSIRKHLFEDPHFLLKGGMSPSHLYFSEFGSSQEQFLIESWTERGIGRALDDMDLLIDFSSPIGNRKLLENLKHHRIKRKAILIGTTGLDRAILQEWIDFCHQQESRILIAANTSLGVTLMVKLAQKAAAILKPLGFDIELIESHHRQKIDSPSGTAKFIAEVLATQENLSPQFYRQGPRESQEIGVVAVRGGSVFGEHELRFMGDLEELTIAHRALSRDLFAKGALHLGRWIAGKSENRCYQLNDIPVEDMVQMNH